ncbi:glycine zipper domain-containing protein [Agrobacterium sp. ES01]|uniref:glycine zipper domain-containing protein n=1 Tax=Agrobacterium sp. ES01 TaxID=3420714 RepID=UPI003D0F21CD
MKKVLLSLGLIAALASCTATERGASVGAAGGAVIGGIASNSVGGAAIGAVAGGVAGALIGRSQERAGYCVYRDRHGRTYEARCR